MNLCYGHVILVSIYHVLTGVSWLSNIKDVRCKPRLHVSVNLLAGVCHHVVRLCGVYATSSSYVHVFCLHYMYTVEHNQRL